MLEFGDSLKANRCCINQALIYVFGFLVLYIKQPYFLFCFWVVTGDASKKDVRGQRKKKKRKICEEEEQEEDAVKDEDRTEEDLQTPGKDSSDVEKKGKQLNA